ncbi:SDR family NAD(P)-dependent oxidoreductase [Seongchinamella sediminis]|uniref:SDR family NAD(P)-dependent oxidoreductase n=1 Tax=Seongchinamella sediminis TaxID=2283635 RepID=A0A3L7DXM9_9GAMM|nr:SDR family oxidoreductase [Seongchinamella sediminis]RLQ21936.1 SDR family NAD(P)-dependent oxidoreductase [Seongchinamella sediminis]
MSQQQSIALVTGASSGIGEEFCRQLAGRCERIIAVARRRDRLEALREELAGETELHPVTADLLSVEGVAQTMEILRQKGPVDILVNNAGFSTYGYFIEAPVGEQRDMLNLHCEASITLTRAALPFMRELGRGQIINLSSLGAFLPGPMLSVYGASKSFLSYFSLGLQQELAATGIRVQALCPGLVRTEIHQPMKDRGFATESFPDEMWMQAEEVVTASLAALNTDKVLVVPGEDNLALARKGVQGLLAALG